MGWITLTYPPNEPVPAFAQALNRAAASLDPLSDTYIAPGATAPRSLAELEAIDKIGE